MLKTLIKLNMLNASFKIHVQIAVESFSAELKNSPNCWIINYTFLRKNKQAVFSLLIYLQYNILNNIFFNLIWFNLSFDDLINNISINFISTNLPLTWHKNIRSINLFSIIISVCNNRQEARLNILLTIIIFEKKSGTKYTKRNWV